MYTGVAGKATESLAGQAFSIGYPAMVLFRPRLRMAQDTERGSVCFLERSLSGKSRLHYGWVVLALSTLVVFGSLGLARFGYTLVLPAMQKGLGFENTGAGFLATANLAGYLALAVAGGALAARFGPRAMITLGLAVVGLGMLFTGLANSFPAVAAWRALTGIGSGASNVPVMGLLASWFATNRRGMAAGIAVTGSSIALITASPLVPNVLAAYGPDGWRACWFIFGSTALVLACTSWVFLRNTPVERGLTAVGEVPTGRRSVTAKAQALRWGTVYRSPVVWHLGLVYVAYGFSYIIYMTFFAKVLIAEGGYSQDQAGRVFMLMGWFSLLCGLLWGTVSDRVGRRAALVSVYLVHTVSFSLFALWQAPPGFILSAALFGLSAWSIPAIMAATCGDAFGSRLAPAALGFVTMFFGIGQAVAPSIAGAMADSLGSFRPAMLLAAGVALCGAIGATSLRPARLRAEHG